MDIDSRLAVSYYNTIAEIDAAHQVFLVQHSETKAIRLKKVLTVYSLDVFKLLKDYPVLGVPRVIELFEDNGTLTVIEDYIPGETIESVMQTSDGFDISKTVEIAVGLCEILSRLHSLKPPVIHRDIKPSNVLLASTGGVFLLDFNAARLSDGQKERDTRLIGTVGYAAPEQYGFASSDVRTDIYALGVLMRTILDPSEATRLPEKVSKLNAIIERCTRLDPQDRFSSADELKLALAPLDKDHQAVSRSQSGTRKYRLPLILIPAAAALAVLIAVYMLRGDRGASSESIIASKDSEDPHLYGGNFEAQKKLPLEVVETGFNVIKDDGENEVNYMIGIRNPNSDYIVLYPQFNVSVRASDGSILASEDQMLWQVAAGDTVWFADFFRYNGKISQTVEFDLYDDGIYETADADKDLSTDSFEIKLPQIVPGSHSGAYRCTGEVTNNSDNDVSNLVISVIFKKDGEFIKGTYTFVYALKAGKTTAFQTPPVELDDFDSFEVYVSEWDQD